MVPTFVGYGALYARVGRGMFGLHPLSFPRPPGVFPTTRPRATPANSPLPSRPDMPRPSRPTRQSFSYRPLATGLVWTPQSSPPDVSTQALPPRPDYPSRYGFLPKSARPEPSDISTPPPSDKPSLLNPSLLDPPLTTGQALPSPTHLDLPPHNAPIPTYRLVWPSSVLAFPTSLHTPTRSDEPGRSDPLPSTTQVFPTLPYTTGLTHA